MLLSMGRLLNNVSAFDWLHIILHIEIMKTIKESTAPLKRRRAKRIDCIDCTFTQFSVGISVLHPIRWRYSIRVELASNVGAAAAVVRLIWLAYCRASCTMAHAY